MYIFRVKIQLFVALNQSDPDPHWFGSLDLHPDQDKKLDSDRIRIGIKKAGSGSDPHWEKRLDPDRSAPLSETQRVVATWGWCRRQPRAPA